MATTSSRLAWPDVAKGMSILGVILLHVSIAVPGAQDSLLAQLNTLLDPLRMPLFFLISGFFSAKVLRFSFTELCTTRLWFFFVPYAVWVPVELYVKNREYLVVHASDMPGVSSYLYHLAFGVNMAWFLYALITFNLALWLVRKLPVWAAMGASFLPILTLPWHFDYHMLGKAVLYLPIFFFGVYARAYLRSYAERALQPRVLAATMGLYLVGLVVFIGWNHVREVRDFQVLWPGPGAETVDAAALELVVRLATHFLMLGAGITLAVVIAKITLVARGLQFIGRHTLPIYVGHPIALTAVYHYTQYRLQLPISAEAEHWVASTGFWMLACFLISLLGGLALWALAHVPVLGWVVTPPPIDAYVVGHLSAPRALVVSSAPTALTPARR